MLGQTNFDKSEELVFTGKTYIYYETPFTLEQLGQLDAYYRSKGMSPQFRGLDYMASVWLNEKLKSYPAPPTTQNP